MLLASVDSYEGYVLNVYRNPKRKCQIDTWPYISCKENKMDIFHPISLTLIGNHLFLLILQFFKMKLLIFVFFIKILVGRKVISFFVEMQDSFGIINK